MDELVQAAMRKWPNVPDCYGWLGLDARGDWYMRDDATQQRGSFQSGPGSKGSRLQHDKLVAFIGRNYAKDHRGCWYFQNGPQRVYVELIHAPWVCRLAEHGEVQSHTGLSMEVQACLVDESGLVYLHTQLGLGLVHSQDVGVLADWVEKGRLAPQDVQASDLPEQYGFVLSPQVFISSL